MKTERNLRDEIAAIVAKLTEMSKRTDQPPLAEEIVHFALVSTKIARVFDIASQRAEKVSKRLVVLTWALIALTFALLVFTVYLYKDTHALVKREQAAQTHDAKHP
jgi:hypothetical protein